MEKNQQKQKQINFRRKFNKKKLQLLIYKFRFLTAIVYPDFQKIYDEKINNISGSNQMEIIDKYNRTVPDYKNLRYNCC